MKQSAIAVAPANIAFMKYWGNANESLRIPYHGSLSMNVTGAETKTTVTFDDSLTQDELIIDGKPVAEGELKRVSRVLDEVRTLSGLSQKARVESQNSFPKGAGIASSASAFAALATAATAASGIQIALPELSALARLGSGSACRSIPDGFVEWLPGTDHQTSYAQSLYPAEYWDLVDLITIVDTKEKEIGSSVGHGLAETSPLYAARKAALPAQIATMKTALANKDFTLFGETLEAEMYSLHAIMMTSNPSILYWTGTTVDILHAVRGWRKEGLEAYCSLDAGPNVHVFCQEKDLEQVQKKIHEVSGVQRVIVGRSTVGARVVEKVT